MKGWQAVVGIIGGVAGIAGLLWRASMAAVFKGADLAVGEAKELRDENRLLRAERDAYRAQLIAAGLEPHSP